jgi:hypothetical protein
MVFKIVALNTQNLRKSFHFSNQVLKLERQIRGCEFTDRIRIKYIGLFLANIEYKMEQLNTLSAMLYKNEEVFTKELNSKTYFMLLKTFLNVSLTIMKKFHFLEHEFKTKDVFKKMPELKQSVLFNSNFIKLKFSIFKSFSQLSKAPENKEWIKGSELFKGIYDKGKLKSFSNPDFEALAQEVVNAVIRVK